MANRCFLFNDNVETEPESRVGAVPLNQGIGFHICSTLPRILQTLHLGAVLNKVHLENTGVLVGVGDGRPHAGVARMVKFATRLAEPHRRVLEIMLDHSKRVGVLLIPIIFKRPFSPGVFCGLEHRLPSLLLAGTKLLLLFPTTGTGLLASCALLGGVPFSNWHTLL